MTAPSTYNDIARYGEGCKSHEVLCEGFSCMSRREPLPATITDEDGVPLCDGCAAEPSNAGK